ncbi:nSTAND1 domain-containing NTPase [Streptomyces cinnamoneus]
MRTLVTPCGTASAPCLPTGSRASRRLPWPPFRPPHGGLKCHCSRALRAETIFWGALTDVLEGVASASAVGRGFPGEVSPGPDVRGGDPSVNDRGQAPGDSPAEALPSGPAQAGERLRRRRLERGVSLAKLARLAFYSKGYLSKVENGEKPLTVELARGCDQVLETGGELAQLVLPAVKGNGRRARGAERCPYRGLSPFGAGDAQWFFGRDEAVAEVVSQLAERLRTPGPLLVMAPSGAGKSSLLRAGLLPALARGVLPVTGSQAWPVALLTPGEHPLEELLNRIAVATGASRRLLAKAHEEGGGALATAVCAAVEGMRRAAGPTTAHGKAAYGSATGEAAALVLVVDQFEEAFMLCSDDGERAAFVQALLSLTARREDDGAGLPSALVVLGVRADFYDRCLAFPGLAASLQRGHVTVGPMDDAHVRVAVTRPARAAGLEVEPGLVEILLRDIGLMPGQVAHAGAAPGGALPLLSHALLSTWQHRENATLTVDGYRLTGGVSGAVAATAERAHTSLSARQQAAARRVLLQLIQVGEDRETSRPCRRQDLLEAGTFRPGDPEAVIEAFTRARLLIVDAEHVEIAHEVLLHAWPRLRRWIDDDRAGLRTRQSLAEAAAAWQDEGHDPSLLYRGPRLAAALEALANPQDEADLAPASRRFLEASRALETAEELKEKRRLRRLRVLTSGLTALLVLSLVAGGVAFQQSRAAEHQRHLAVSRELAAQADAVRTDHPQAAALLAVRAFRQAHTAEARSTLLSAYAGYRSADLKAHRSFVNRMAFSPDGHLIATAGADRAVKLWDAATRQMTATLTGHTDAVEDVAFSPDGRILATASDDQSVKLWDLTTRKVTATLTGHNNNVNAVSFSPDGRMLATAGNDRAVRLWDTRSHREIASFTGHTDDVVSVAFSPDGHTLASAGSDRTVRLWDTAEPRGTATLGGHTGTVISVAFSPDGRTLASGGTDRTTRLWDPRSRQLTAVLSGHTDSVYQVAFSPDGHTLATVGFDATARLWDVAGQRQTRSMDGKHKLLGAAFSPDGRFLATTGNTEGDKPDMRVWETSTGRQIAGFGGEVAPATATAFSRRGNLLAVSGRDAAVALYAAYAAEPVKPVATLTTHLGEVAALAFSPDGGTLAVRGAGGSMELWDVAGKRERGTVATQQGGLNAGAFSPDGRTIATAGDDNTVKLWGARTQRVTATLAGHTASVLDVAFSPDGRTLATGSLDRTARLWDTRSGRQNAVLAHGWQVLCVAFSPDGRTVATGDYGRTTLLWDATTHQQTARLTGHSRAVVGVAFSPDGRTLATTSPDRTTFLWDVASRRRSASLTSQADVRAPSFSPDGHTLATGSATGTALLWEIDVNDVVQHVCQESKAQGWARIVPHAAAKGVCS